MIPFPTADAVWPEGSVRWRMCLLPRPQREPGLQRLLDRARKALAPFPLAEVSEADLNIGICPLERPEVPSRRLLRDLAASLTEHLADLPPFGVAIGAAHVGVGSVLLQLGIPPQWSELTGRVGAGLAAVLSPQALGPAHERPHLTIAYGAGHCDCAEVAAALEAALARERAEVLIEAVHLVQVQQNAPAHGYRLAPPTVSVPLGTAQPQPDLTEAEPASPSMNGSDA